MLSPNAVGSSRTSTTAAREQEHGRPYAPERQEHSRTVAEYSRTGDPHGSLRRWHYLPGLVRAVERLALRGSLSREARPGPTR
jgi:hypothetical protein